MKTERVLFVSFLVSLVLELFHIPGRHVLMILSLGTASLIYFPLAFYFFSDGNLKRQSLPLSIIAGLLLSIAVLGVLFKIMRWPGGIIMQWASFPVIGLLGIIFEMKKTAKEELATYYRNMVIRVSIVLVVALGIFLLPKSTLNHFMPTIEDRLREQYLKDTTDIGAKQEYESFMEERNKN